MQKHIHPEYHPVVFRDRSAGKSFLTNSTRTSEKTVTWEDGREYPVIDVEVSAASHPFWTGRGTVLDTAGRVERFRRRYADKVLPRRRPPGPARSTALVMLGPLRDPARRPLRDARGPGPARAPGNVTQQTGAPRPDGRILSSTPPR
jgi:large subunit ribosomal protein L31